MRYRDLIAALLAGAVAAPAWGQSYPSPTFNTVTVRTGLSLSFSEPASYVLAAPSGGGAPVWRALAGVDVPVFTSTLVGVVPASGGGTANFMRADGGWAVPPGLTSGTVTSIVCGTGLTGGTITAAGTCAMAATGTAGTYGDATHTLSLTIDAQGRTSAVVANLITPAGIGAAPLASPALTGSPTAPTQTAGDNSTKLATDAFVAAAVSAGTAGVSSFDTRTGAVTLSSSDVTGALGFTPLSSVPYAATATSGGLLASTCTAGQYVTGLTTGTGALTCGTPAGGGGTPGGSSGQVQYNNGGAFGGLTNAQLTADINQFTSSLPGSVPASGGGTGTFLRADDTFAAVVTSVTCGTGLSGGTFTTTGTCSMPNTGTAGSYGAAASVPVITTDAQGRVTAVSAAAITPAAIAAAPSGSVSLPQHTSRFYSSSSNSFTTQTDQSTSSVTVLTATPIYLTGGNQVKSLAFYITAGVSASFTVHMGLAADNGGSPAGSTILVDSGAVTVAASATGAQIATISSGPTPAAGWYWLILEMPYLATSPTMDAFNVGSPGAMGTAQMGVALTQGSAVSFCNGLVLGNGNQTSYGAIVTPFPTGPVCANYNLPVVWVGF